MSPRNTIFVEDATVILHQKHKGDQYILRLNAPRIAQHARPGSFIHIRCHEMIPMRRPLSIMRTNPKDGWVELLYRLFGEGTKRLSQHKTGEQLSLMGPIGKPFVFQSSRPRPLLIGGGVGIPPMIFLVDSMRKATEKYQPLLLMGSETPYPFTPRPSQILTPALPDNVIAAMPLMEDWGITSRLASLQNYPGCFAGYVTDLARYWLKSLTPDQLDQVEIFACGPHPMLEATAQLAHDYKLPCQVSLEEFMACAVGGCAGCTVLVETAQGPAMKRVCVDGPVFDAKSVFPTSS